MARRITCEQISPLLSAYLDGELSQAERETVEWHLRECEVCRSELKELEEAKNFTLQLGEVQPPLSLRARIMARVEKEKVCETIRPLLGAYLDGEVSETDSSRVEEHLASCEECKKELEAEMKVRQLLQTVPEVEPPLYLRARIYATIERKPVLIRRFALGFATLAAAASLVFFALPVNQTTPPAEKPVVVAQQKHTSQTETVLSQKSVKIATKPSKKRTPTVAEKPQKTILTPTTREQISQPTAQSQPSEVTTEEMNPNSTRPVVMPVVSEKTSATQTAKEETKIAQQPQPAEKPASQPTPIKLAIKPEPSLADVLKGVARSVDKPSMPSRLTEKLDKSIVLGVAKVEF